MVVPTAIPYTGAYAAAQQAQAQQAPPEEDGDARRSQRTRRRRVVEAGPAEAEERTGRKTRGRPASARDGDRGGAMDVLI